MGTADPRMKREPPDPADQDAEVEAGLLRPLRGIAEHEAARRRDLSYTALSS